MKLKLNSKFKDHDKLVERISEELPELILRSKERKWGEGKPSFKYKKTLYEFDDLDELLSQAKKILHLSEKDLGKKNKEKVVEIEPDEATQIRQAEELILEIPVEKYDLKDLNIKLRLGSHQEKSSTYESEEQTLHYEVEETEEELVPEESVEINEPEISMVSMNNEIILDIPSERFSLNDLNLSIRFTRYDEPSSTYEVNPASTEEAKPDSAEEGKSEEGMSSPENLDAENVEVHLPEHPVTEPMDRSKEVGPEDVS